MYCCPCCGEPAITLGQKAWACYCGRSATCRNCGGSVGISTAVLYLTNAPILLYLLGVYLYASWGPKITDETFWLIVASLFVVPMIYYLLATAVRVWLVPLACGRQRPARNAKTYQ